MKSQNLFLLSVLLVELMLLTIQKSQALFSDTAISSANTFIASNEFPLSVILTTTTTSTPTATPSLTSTPTVTPTVAPEDVVINELNWVGNNNSDGGDDEWIELRNMTNRTIDLNGWQITSLVGNPGSEQTMMTIGNGYYLSPNNYFLISNFSESISKINLSPDIVNNDVVLRNTNMQIKLYKGDWAVSSNLIDTADDGNGQPFKGSNTAPKKSMERKDLPGDGTVSTNWQDASTHTNMDGTGETDEFGTPKAPNGV